MAETPTPDRNAPAPTCPRCRGNEVHRLPDIWVAGTADATEGVGPAALSASPPAEQSYGAGALVTVLGALLTWGALGTGFTGLAIALALIVVAGLWMLASAIRYNHGARVRAHDEWERSYRCARCGMVFAP